MGGKIDALVNLPVPSHFSYMISVFLHLFKPLVNPEDQHFLPQTQPQNPTTRDAFQHYYVSIPITEPQRAQPPP
jgi:hypothetical protein